MEVIIQRSYEEMSRSAAQIVVEVLNTKPNAVLGMATGSTPLGLYQELVRLHKEEQLVFSRVTTFTDRRRSTQHQAECRARHGHRFHATRPLSGTGAAAQRGAARLLSRDDVHRSSSKYSTPSRMPCSAWPPVPRHSASIRNWCGCT